MHIAIGDMMSTGGAHSGRSNWKAGEETAGEESARKGFP